jgi:hypothetical protein
LELDATWFVQWVSARGSHVKRMRCGVIWVEKSAAASGGIAASNGGIAAKCVIGRHCR